MKLNKMALFTTTLVSAGLFTAAAVQAQNGMPNTDADTYNGSRTGADVNSDMDGNTAGGGDSTTQGPMAKETKAKAPHKTKKHGKRHGGKAMAPAKAKVDSGEHSAHAPDAGTTTDSVTP